MALKEMRQNGLDKEKQKGNQTPYRQQYKKERKTDQKPAQTQAGKAQIDTSNETDKKSSGFQANRPSGGNP
jgi:hypothetical protein